MYDIQLILMVVLIELYGGYRNRGTVGLGGGGFSSLKS